LNALIERHATKVYNFLLRLLQNQEDAADLAQETFAKVYHNRSRFDPRQKFSTWLYAIASNLARDRFRWRTRHPQFSLDTDLEHSETNFKENLRHPGISPDEDLQREERAAAVRAAVSALPPELREPLILSVYEGMAHAEIGKILNCSAKAVETRIYRARNRLRQELGDLLPAL
jgi:RNA polymerase sigma-70 factor (ECF subfamily)